jgi:hypothetical protein
MLGQAIDVLPPAAAAVRAQSIPIVAVVPVLDSARARTNGPTFVVGGLSG